MFSIMIISSLTIATSSSLFLATNPLSMGIIILLMALFLAILYSSLLTSWIAFLIFLIYIGGMLVMFAYFVAITPNQQMNLLMFSPMILMMMTLPILMLKFCYSPMSISFVKSTNLMYIMNNIPLLMLLALILLFTMIVVVKLVTSNKGPLRPFM